MKNTSQLPHSSTKAREETGTVPSAGQGASGASESAAPPVRSPSAEVLRSSAFGGPHSPIGGARRCKLGVLVVDDSLTVRMDLQQTLEIAGFSVMLCASLGQARQALAENSPALVILDVLLPDGDGTELLHEIKSAGHSSPPVMLLSTEAEVSDRVRGLKTGADDYVGKPYDAGYVLARARELTGSSGPARSPAPRVLLVDDSATSRLEYRSILESAGYSVITAESGEEGLRAALDFRPDALISDRVLSGDLDGDAVIRRLKQDIQLRNIPCLMLTGSGDAAAELSGLEAGADGYLEKGADGNVFLARLAALIRSAVSAPPEAATQAGMLGAKKILAVDDSMTYLNELAAQLRQERYDMILALSGAEALELLAVQPVDGILLDLRMPGMSGNEVCRRIKDRPELRGIPVLMLTAEEGAEALIEGINAGADDYICKSADFTVLKARLRAQLRRKQFEDEYRVLQEKLLRKEREAVEARAEAQIVEARAAMVDELEKKNRELEAFAYAVSHDLRAPLRAIRGFGRILMDDFGDRLPEGAVGHLDRIQTAAVRMGQLIDSLLELSRASRSDLRRDTVSVSQLARSVAGELADVHPSPAVDWSVAAGLEADADPALLRVVFQNLLGNGWKFTAKAANPRVEVGAVELEGEPVYFVRDNGVGFDSASAKQLFEPFERLHPATDFPGAGIGLATVRRVIERHGGRIWAVSTPGNGACFFFTLGSGTSRQGADGNEPAGQSARMAGIGGGTNE